MSAEGHEDKRVKPDSEATQIIRVVGLTEAEFFRTPTGDPYVTVPIADHSETYALGSRAYRAWLNRVVYKGIHKCPSATALQAATNTLAAVAQFDGLVNPVQVRVAECEGALWLDLGDPDWQVVRITPKGWKVLARGPVRFRRPRGMLALPLPSTGGSLLDLCPFVNVADEDFPLVGAWLIAALRPTGPYAVLAMMGVHGAAKSTAARVVRRTIDPNKADLRRPPRNTEDLMISAVNNHVVTLENVSSMPAWLSDDLAALATGSGLSKRALFKDAEECILHAQRPILINGISGVVTRPDLLDRSLVFTAPVIQDEKRREESEFWDCVRSGSSRDTRCAPRRGGHGAAQPCGRPPSLQTPDGGLRRMGGGRRASLPVARRDVSESLRGPQAGGHRGDARWEPAGGHCARAGAVDGDRQGAARRAGLADTRRPQA